MRVPAIVLVWLLALTAACRTRPVDVTTDLAPANRAVAGDLARCPQRLNSLPTMGVQCGPSQTCTLADGCCDGEQATDQATCGASSSSCFGPKLHCDGPEDCAAGQQCCLTLGLVREQDTVQCAAGCASSFCHSDSDCPTGTLCYADEQYFYGVVGTCQQPCG